MQEKLRILPLKIVALSAVFSFLYPAVIVLRSFFFANGGGVTAFVFAIVLVSVGYILSGFRGKNKSDEIKELIPYFLVIIPSVFVLVVYLNNGANRIIFEICAVLLFYFVGMNAKFISFDEILSANKIRTGIFLIAFSIFINLKVHAGGVIYFFAYTFMILSMIVKNQTNIDRIFIKMNRKLSGVSGEIRKYNLILICGLFVITGLFFNLKSILVVAFKIAGSVLQWLRMLIWKVMLFFLSFIAPGESKPLEKTEPKFDFGQDNSIHPIMNLIFRVLAYSILLFAAYKLAPIIWRFTRKLFLTVYKNINNAIKKNKALYIIEEDYADEIENLDSSYLLPEPKKSRKDLFRAERNIKGLKKIINPIEKIRYLYGIIIDGLIEKNLEIKKADTADEIYYKSLSIKGIEVYLLEVTAIYNCVRYGDAIPTKDQVSKVESNCLEIIRLLRNKKSNQI